jgi:hypothetical protein
MDIEYTAEQEAESTAALRRIENLERKINSLKVFSQSRKTARRQLLLQRRKAQIRKLSQHEEESKSDEPAKYRKDSLRGLVTQVP